MTRDEAIAAFDSIERPASFTAAAWIDRFAALGMLKLEEPKTIDQKFNDGFESEGYGQSSIDEVARIIDQSGLKVVEK